MNAAEIHGRILQYLSRRMRISLSFREKLDNIEGHVVILCFGLILSLVLVRVSEKIKKQKESDFFPRLLSAMVLN